MAPSTADCLADAFSVSRSTIQKILRARSIPTQQRARGVAIQRQTLPMPLLTDQQVTEICQRYQAGESILALSRTFGVSTTTVWRRFAASPDRAKPLALDLGPLGRSVDVD